MEDKDFDNIFGDKLKKQKDFPFSEQKWTVLERQYDQLLAENRYKRLFLFGSVSLLTLLSCLFWTLSSLSDTNKKLDDLAYQIHLLQQKKMDSLTPSVYLENVPKSDTIFHKMVVYRYDTIYQTVIRRDIFQSNINGLNNKNQTSITENSLDEQGNKKYSAPKSAIIKSDNSTVLEKKAELITEKGLKEEQPIFEQIKTINSKQNDSINLVKTTSSAKQIDTLSKKVALVKITPPLSTNVFFCFAGRKFSV